MYKLIRYKYDLSIFQWPPKEPLQPLRMDTRLWGAVSVLRGESDSSNKAGDIARHSG